MTQHDPLLYATLVGTALTERNPVRVVLNEIRDGFRYLWHLQDHRRLAVLKLEHETARLKTVELSINNPVAQTTGLKFDLTR